jgi:hypothetical protein
MNGMFLLRKPERRFLEIAHLLHFLSDSIKQDEHVF